MTESKGHLCPECGAPRGADNTPSCGCTRRASDALRDAREAEQAAAEDFDPLRIRPYVDLDGESPEAPAPTLAAPPDATMRLRPISVPPPPSTTDLSLFENAPPHEGTPTEPRPRNRTPHRRTLILASAAALVAVIAAAGLASGLLSYDSPQRDTALPEEIRASVPDASTSSAQASPSTSTTSAGPTSASPSASVSASESPSPSPSRSSASPTPSSPSEKPTATTTSAAPTDTADNSSTSRESTPPVLRRGSQGDEVVELELRLTQLNLYPRKASGHYNEGVEDAVTRYQWARGIQVTEYGVYDLATRETLESETTEP
ncbi:peptidoglycan-binding domain-containing protein [Streptomyces sp. NPDC051913]|uniref:peptidoglycan-binding domain-containing protein n=1 Tax=Streptomyces sp. NPDC051913 TaxID=3365676 RepID=UPI0037D78F9E